MSKGKIPKIRIVKVESIKEELRGFPPPKIDAKVDAERAVKVLQNWPGGKEVIEELRKAGKKI